MPLSQPGAVPDPLLLSDGAVGAPTYSFTSNPTTGLFLPAANQLSFVANGVEITRAQGVVGANQFIVSPGLIDNNEALPSLALGDGDSGFFESIDDAIGVSLAGSRAWIFQAASFTADTPNGPQIMNEAAATDNPTLIPMLGDPASGVGADGGTGDNVHLIARSLSCLAIAVTGGGGGVRQVGFYVTAPVSLQTGVAVTAAGVHAALVNLGLITA